MRAAAVAKEMVGGWGRLACLILVLLGSGAAATPALADGFIIVQPTRPPHPMPHPPGPQRPPRPPRDHFAFAPLEVVYHQVTVEINGLVATTSIDQEFRNPSNARLEGTYVFPMPVNAHIDKFEMDVAGVMTTAELLPADKAREIYEDIVRKMRDPALLEYAGRGAFKARIFPIEPRSTKRIKISYTQLLSADGGLAEYVYPLNTEKFSAKPLERVALKIVINDDRPLGAVYCPSHAAEIRRDGDRRVVIGYEDRNVRPDTDFKVVFGRRPAKAGDGDGDAAPASIELLSAHDGTDGHYLLLATPPAAADGRAPAPKDICFVLDTSGSMSGGKLDQARKALHYCLDNLNADDRFEILRFSTEVEPLFGRLTPADDAGRARARAFLDKMRPTGGTAIADALSAARKLGAHADADTVAVKGRPYIVAFLTDGQPTIGETNEDKLLALVNDAGAGSPPRIFTLGVGDDVNTHLLDRLALDSRAAVAYVGSREDLELKMAGFFGRIKDPALMNLELTVAGEGIRVFERMPTRLPDLFAGDQLVVFGRYEGSGPVTVTLAGDAAGVRKTCRVEAGLVRDDLKNGYIARLWATRRVGFLLDEIRLRGESAELKEEVTRLARRYGIVTPYTAYLVLEDEARRNVPVAQRNFRGLADDAPARERLRASYDSLARESKENGSRVGADAVQNARATLALRNSASDMDDQYKKARSYSRRSMTLGDAGGGGMPAAAAAPLPPSVSSYAAGARVDAADVSALYGALSSPALPATAAGTAAAPSDVDGVDGGAVVAAGSGYLSEQRASPVAQTRFVNGQAFSRNADVWVDNRAQSRGRWTTKEVEIASDEYFALLARHPDLSGWLSLGESVDVVLGETLYQFRNTDA